MKEKLIELVDNNYSLSEIARRLGLNNSKTRKMLKQYGLQTTGYIKNNNWDKERMVEALKGAKSKSDVLRNMGISTFPGNFRTLNKYAIKYNIELPVFIKTGDKKMGEKPKKIKNDKLFCENSLHSSTPVKKRILKENLIKYECEKCKNKGFWQNEKLSLQLDHINGINNDHRLENLRYLCPNCHSQTKTFSGKKLKYNKTLCECGNSKLKKSKKCIKCRKNNKVLNFNEKTKQFEISKCELEKLINEKSYVEIGKIFCVSDSAVKKRAKKLGIELKCRKNKFDISKQELQMLINEKSYVEIGKMFNVTDSAIKKRAKKLGIELECRKKRNQFYYKNNSSL